MPEAAKVLIVEDSDAAFQELERLLGTLPGYRLIGRAKDGAEALVLYPRLRPDVVCMDLMMPRLNGIEAIRFLHQLDGEVRIVVISGEWPTDEMASEARRLGARQIVTKPVDVVELRAALDAACGRKQRVLIVDDSAVAAAELATTIQRLPGYDIAGIARDGTEAVTLYKRLAPDAVCMDLMMRRMSGVEAVRVILAHDPKARIVIVTAEWPTETQVTEAVRLGAKGVLTKPVDERELRKVLETA
jgi:two-component system, chemotaxis family, chemotaxis protein CheY